VCKDIISRYLKSIKAKRCLDAGCGPGVYGLFIFKHNLSREAVFLDINAYMLKHVKKELGRYYVLSHIVHAGINNMPFRNEVFEIILAEGGSLTQRRSREDVVKGLSEIRRILKNKGLFLGSISNIYSRTVVKIATIRNVEDISEI